MAQALLVMLGSILLVEIEIYTVGDGSMLTVQSAVKYALTK
jgi:hypothetical protein